MDLQDLLTPDAVRPVHEHLPVEAARPQQGRIEDLGPVRCGDEDDSGRRVEPVHFDKELVQRLLLLVVAAEPGNGAAGAAERVQFVDEDDAGRLGASLLEQVAHARRAHPDEHLHEFRSGDGEERHAGLAGDSLGEQRLARARRTDQQHALRHPRAEPAVLLGVLEERDHLLQLGLGLVDSGDVREGDLGVRLDVHPRLRLADGHQAAAAGPAELLRHPAAEDDPDAEEQGGRHDPRQQHRDEVRVELAAVFDAVLIQLLRDVRVHADGHEALLAVERLLQLARELILRHDDAGDLVLPDQLLELAVGDGGDGLASRPVVLHDQHAHHRDEHVREVEACLLSVHCRRVL